MNAPDVGILSAAYFLPKKKKSIKEVFLEEESKFTNEIALQIGIKYVHIYDGKDPSEMALKASELALSEAGISSSTIDVIIDYSVLPQKYVEPAWSMSNEIQYKLAAKNAFTLGFSGGGSTNFHVALKFATSLIQADSEINTILLMASDKTIPKNRLINQDNPITVLSDAAGAVILHKKAPDNTVLDTCLLSDGNLHDISYVRGGGIANPVRLDLYKMTIDRRKYAPEKVMMHLKQLVNKILSKHSLRLGDIKYFLYPNVSHEDQNNYITTFNIKNDICANNRAQYGHIQATDFVFNYLQLQEMDLEKGDYILMLSHGMGYLAGVTLIKY